jgi:glycosyltransferase involved in cell wall biosynthesis
MTINETMKRYIMNLGVPEERISIFLVDTIRRDRKHIPHAQKGVVRSRHGIGPDAKVLLTVARLEAEKNWPRSLELFATLPDDHVLIVLGMGSLEPELRQMVRTLGVEKRVIFTGFVQREDIWNYYLDADVFVLLSTAEALGIVFWEAMYVNTPVIGSDVEGILESLGSDGERGRVWTESDGIKGYQERVAFCVTPSAERDTMIQKAKEYVDEQLKNPTTINTLPIAANRV